MTSARRTLQAFRCVLPSPLASPVRSVGLLQTRRQFSVQARQCNSVQNAVFSSTQSGNNLQQTLQSLITPAGRWTLTNDGTGIERFFQFKSFKAAWTFMNDVAAQCKTYKHHPEWSNVYNKVFVRWTTHTPRGLSTGDLTLADVCDKFASRDESKEVGSSGGDSHSKLGSLADQAAGKAEESKSGSKQQSEAAKQEEKAKIEKEEGEEGAEGSLAGIGQPT